MSKQLIIMKGYKMNEYLENINSYQFTIINDEMFIIVDGKEISLNDIANEIAAEFEQSLGTEAYLLLKIKYLVRQVN